MSDATVQSHMLARRVLEPDLAGLPDWQVAEKLNAPDSAIAPIVEWRSTQFGIGHVLDCLGLDAGSAVLDALSELAKTQSSAKWNMRLIEANSFDLSRPSARDQLSQMELNGFIDCAQHEKLLGSARVERHPSWSEKYNVFVDARAVGLARGGI